MDIVFEQRRLAADLVENLEALGKDRAAMARLKRCAGRPLAECTEVFALFYPLGPRGGPAARTGARGPASSSLRSSASHRRGPPAISVAPCTSLPSRCTSTLPASSGG